MQYKGILENKRQKEKPTASLRQSSRMSKLDVSVGLETSGRYGAEILCSEPQSSPEKNGWLLKSPKPFLPRRISLSQMSPAMNEWALSDI